MKTDKNTLNFQSFIKEKLSFLDLEAKKTFETSKDLVSFTANRVSLTTKYFLYTYIILGALIFIAVFYSILFLVKPVKGSEELKITRDSFVGLTEVPSKTDIKFSLKQPVAVKWNNEFFFFDKPNIEGKYDVTLQNKEGIHKFYFYAYKSGVFERYISEKPILISKEFDYTKPSLENLRILDKFTTKTSNWSFESNEEFPIIKMLSKGKEITLFDPKSSYQENLCKQEKNNNKVKYTCPVQFDKEESFNISVWMVDKVDNRVDILEDKAVSYIEPLKVDCGQPPSRVRADTVPLKCKSNRTTVFTINNGSKDVIEKDKDKAITLQLGGEVTNSKEFPFIVSFEDPNGTPVELSYKFSKDNSPPAAQFSPTINKTGNVYVLTTQVSGLSENAKLEMSFDQIAAPSANWYFKYPDIKSVSLNNGDNTTFTNYSNEFKLCAKDPINNTETCSGSYTPNFVYYNFKLSDDVGNQSTYQCSYNLSTTADSKCNKF
jgi:hypothetical protein